jgi:Tfp pilus assembly protein PilV
MMHTNPFRRRRVPWGQLGRSHAKSHANLAADDGVSLIEVMVSALMVGFIVIATFTGFNAVNHTTADERAHDQAAQLAAQSLEEMRSDSAATLDTIESAKHVYTQTVGGEKYTITQTDSWTSDTSPNATCSASSKEHSNQAGNYLVIATEVTWPQLKAAGRPALRQKSIITPPDGSALEVDVLNGRTPEQPVAGVTVNAGEAEATTGEAGCVILGGIPATTIEVEAHKLGDVTEAGAIKKVQSELAITPNITTHDEVVLNTGSYITAEFAHEGKTVTSAGQQVTGDTIVAFNPKMNLAPDFEVGSPRFGAFAKETGEYEALTGEPPPKTGPAPYEAKATTPISTEYYPTGDLFPFEKGPWEIYAGDCPANNPAEIDSGEISESSISVALEPGQDPTVKVPTSEVKLTVYKGAKSGGTVNPESNALPVKITNTECLKVKEKEEAKNKTAYNPNNAYKYSVIHTQDTTSKGTLEAPFQPFGKSFKLCLYDSSINKSFLAIYADEKAAGPTIPIYLSEPSGKSYTEGADPTVEVKTNNVC